MNIISDIGNKYQEFEMLGFGKALTHIGHDFLFIKRKEKAILDAFAEKTPQIFFTYFNFIDRATIKAIIQNKKCKTFIFIENEEQIEKLKKIENIIFISNKNINGIKNIEPSCDIFNTLKPKSDDNLKSDICYIGDYKNNFILNKFINNYKTKVFSNELWPHINNIGKIKNNKIKDVIFSSKLSVYDDNCENFSWPLYVYMCERPVINFKSIALNNLLNKNDIYVNNDNEFNNILVKIINNDNEYKELISLNKKYIQNNHLCHNRISDILNYAGFEEESLKCLNAAKEIIKKY